MRTLNRPVVALVVAAGLLVAGCSTTAGSPSSSSVSAAGSAVSVAGTTTAAQSPSVGLTPTSQPPSSAADPGDASAATPTDDPAAVAAQSAARESRRSAIAAATPAEFDAHTTAWFDGVCQPFADVDPVAFDNDGNGKLALVEELRYYRAMADAYLSTSQTLATQPPPNIPGGADLASRLTESLDQAGTGFSGLLEKSLNPNQEILDILHDASNTYISMAYGPISGLDPAIMAAIHTVPSCAAVGW